MQLVNRGATSEISHHKRRKNEFTFPRCTLPTENGVREPHCHARSGGVAGCILSPPYGVIVVPLFDLYIFQFRFGSRGYLWVDFFFILSGFILAYRYGEA